MLLPPFSIFRDGPMMPEMMVLPPGRFLMGADDEDPDAFPWERPQRPVCLSAPLAMGRCPVTVEEYDIFLRATNRPHPDVPRPDVPPPEPRSPAVCVSWHDAVAYTRWLIADTGQPYRLPTEAEWEYAARAERTDRFGLTDNPARLSDIAWYAANCNEGRNERLPPVGQKGPNGFGLYDLIGLIWEWTADLFAGDAYRTHDAYPDMRGSWTAAGNRVIRGGSRRVSARFLRVSYRGQAAPDRRDVLTGFRVARQR